MKKFIIFTLSLLLLSCNNKHDDACVWDYPADLQFLPIQQRMDALQIPENILLCLSTEALMDLSLQYPLLENIFSFDLLDEGLDRLFAEFNGIRALFARADIARVLLKRYNEKISNLPLQENIFILDALLSRVKGQEETLKEILRSLFTGYDVISMQDVDNELLLQYNFFSRAHIILKISDEYLDDIPLGEKNPVFAPAGADSETAAIINRLSYRLCYCNQEEADLWEYPEVMLDEFYLLWSPPILHEFQIPETILYCLSTERLTDLCLQIPFRRCIEGGILSWYVSDVNLFRRYLQILLDYNGVKELYTRKDATYWLLKRYNEEIQSYLENEALVTQPGITYNPRFSNLPYPEIMLTHVNEQDNEILKEILRNLVAGHEAVLSRFGYMRAELYVNYWARLCIIRKICEQCIPELIYFETYYLGNADFDDEDAAMIDQLSYELIK